MPISALAHFSVRTNDLEASRQFYTQILGLTEGMRPEFKFPGVWLYRGGDEADYGAVHLIGVDPHNSQGLADYLGDKTFDGLRGSGAVDHVAFTASGLPDMRARLQRAGHAFRERSVPGLGLHQVFVDDPSGITIELNFPAAEAAVVTAAVGAIHA